MGRIVDWIDDDPLRGLAIALLVLLVFVFWVACGQDVDAEAEGKLDGAVYWGTVGQAYVYTFEAEGRRWIMVRAMNGGLDIEEVR